MLELRHFFVPLLICIALVMACSSTDDDNKGNRSTSDPNGRHKATAEDASTPDAFAKAVLQTLIDNDKERFKSFAVLGKQELLDCLRREFKAYMATYVKGEDSRRRMQTELDDWVEQVGQDYEESTEEILSSWDEVRRDAEKDGVVWRTATPLEPEYIVWFARGCTRYCDAIQVNFVSGGVEYGFTISDVIEIDGQWVIIENGLVWRGARKEEGKDGREESQEEPVSEQSARPVVKVRGTAPPHVAELVLKVRGVDSYERAELLFDFLNRDDLFEVADYVRLEVSPRSGFTQVVVNYAYGFSMESYAFVNDDVIKFAITEPYYDQSTSQWRASPFVIEGYDPLEPSEEWKSAYPDWFSSQRRLELLNRNRH